MRKFYLPLVIVLTVAGGVQAQTSTYNRVYNILQTNCAATCHSSANHAGNLDLSGSEANVLAALVDVTPANPTAAALGNKLIDKGDARNSFLFKKVHRGLDANLSLSLPENPATHDTLTALTEVEREMIRQWILFGAKDTGVLVDESVITTFYVTQGAQPRITPLAPPAPNEGTQVYWGPLFMPVGHEFEYDSKFYVRNPYKADVTRMNCHENVESHHFAVYKYLPNKEQLFAKGMHKVNGIIDAANLFYAADVIAQWPNSIDLQYPQGTGYLYDSASVLNLSYHLINYNDSVIAAEAYLNIYYQPHSPSTIPIKTDQIRYGGDEIGSLVIPPLADSTYTWPQFDPNEDSIYNIISMQAHTHALGKDYNVWTRKLDGSKDTLIYNGKYDATYTFNQGVYLWNNPPYRQFDPPAQVDLKKGLIHEARFKNPSPTNYVGFGLTTLDEMFVTFILYYKTAAPLSIGDNTYVDETLKLYPNPVRQSARIELNEGAELRNAEMKIYDLMGREVTAMKGIEGNSFRMDMANLTDGCYLFRLFDEGKLLCTGKLAVQH